MKSILAAAALALGCCGGATAATYVEDETGVHERPPELSVEYWAARAEHGDYDPVMCAYGYPLAKMGWHDAARKIIARCAKEGNVQSMAWAAWIDENGYDRPSDPAAAAAWDRKLSETGSSIGDYNYALDLLRGHGVAQDIDAGKKLIDRAAAAGDAPSQALARQNYDPDSATPTADLAHYRKPMF